MNIIVISDIHGDVENLITYLDKIKEYKFDVIVCPGDFTDTNVPRGFTQDDIARLIIKELKTLKKPILAVPGNMDTKGIIKILDEEDVSIHGKGRIIDNFGFYGYGGAQTPFGTNIEPTEEEMKLGLKNAYNDVKNSKYKIQVTHNPPSGSRLDIIQSGLHVGSNAVRESIEIYKPIVAISAHIHEARETDYLKDTFLLNSGRFPEGYFGLINIKNNFVNGKIINLLG
ncbi:MAG: metallophosphoesterase [Candidatus Aenigmarchaeota archaeon]|nr:metallophosphoesterase [Candidatus Aenigmarchaeota archaeon]